MRKNPYIAEFFVGQIVEFTREYTSLSVPFRAKVGAKAEITDSDSIKSINYHISVKWLDSLSMRQSDGWYRAGVFKPTSKLNRFDLI